MTRQLYIGKEYRWDYSTKCKEGFGEQDFEKEPRLQCRYKTHSFLGP